MVADYLSRLVNSFNVEEDSPFLHESFLDKQLFSIQISDPYLWKFCPDQVIKKCVPKNEFNSTLTFCHSHVCGGHFGGKKTALKVLESGFYWPSLFKDAYAFCMSYDRCQRTCNIGPRNQMPLTPILVVEIFYVWGIDLMGP